MHTYTEKVHDGIQQIAQLIITIINPIEKEFDFIFAGCVHFILGAAAGICTPTEGGFLEIGVTIIVVVNPLVLTEHYKPDNYTGMSHTLCSFVENVMHGFSSLTVCQPHVQVGRKQNCQRSACKTALPNKHLFCIMH